jgi:hypothetical protein
MGNLVSFANAVNLRSSLPPQRPDIGKSRATNSSIGGHLQLKTPGKPRQRPQFGDALQIGDIFTHQSGAVFARPALRFGLRATQQWLGKWPQRHQIARGTTRQQHHLARAIGLHLLREEARLQSKKFTGM